jgi:NRAMP (natural resistance-associated macrophage protein)-like metal ion transporter
VGIKEYCIPLNCLRGLPYGSIFMARLDLSAQDAAVRCFLLQTFVRPTSAAPSQQHPSVESRQKKGVGPAQYFFSKLGPGIITGASDDDPSGIATYSQVGAQFGYAMLWTMLFSYPLMSAFQEISARIGRITGSGIASNLRKHYPKPLLYTIVMLLLAANIFNLAADLGAMGAAAKLLLPGGEWMYTLAFGIFSLVIQILIPYRKYVHYLKWLTVALFSYVATAIFVGQPGLHALRATILPSISFHGEYLTALVAVLGTTISPYLFFWQASQEAEEVSVHSAEKPLNKAPSQAPENFDRIRIDTYMGMGFSNLVGFFIILTTAATLHVHGISNIQTADQAAKALEPLAGHFAFFLFTLGMVGTGLLSVPVLAGSAAYAVSEAFRWRASLEKKPSQAAKFYGTLAFATLLGIAINFAHLNPIRALFLAAVINGLVAVPVMVFTMILSRNPKVIGKFRLSRYLTIVGWAATAVMLFASVGMIATLGKQ